jgi:hypothetical protein
MDIGEVEGNSSKRCVQKTKLIIFSLYVEEARALWNTIALIKKKFFQTGEP